MFKALNTFISRLDADTSSQTTSQGVGDSSYGFQVLRNTNPSLPIEPWFDFIVGINGHVLDDPDPNLFATEVRNCAGTTLSLDLWSAKGQRTYNISVPAPPTPESLGLSLQISPLDSTQNIWHILSIPSPLSPAHLAGLLPHSDYILGSPSGTLRGESALGELVEDHLNRSLILWVYNSEFDVVREIELVPRRGWGGDGALGAVLGFGALHRLPAGLGEEVQAPGERLFDAGGDARPSLDAHATTNDSSEGHFLVPAEMKAPPPTMMPVGSPLQSPTVPPTRTISSSSGPLTPSAPSRSGRKAKHHAIASPKSGFDAMFAEGAQKSAEQDLVPSRKGTPPAPPPKAGGVPPRPRAASPEKSSTEDIGEPGDAEET